MQGSYKGYYLEEIDAITIGIYDSVENWRNKIECHHTTGFNNAAEWIDEHPLPGTPKTSLKWIQPEGNAYTHEPGRFYFLVNEENFLGGAVEVEKISDTFYRVGGMVEYEMTDIGFKDNLYDAKRLAEEFHKKRYPEYY